MTIFCILLVIIDSSYPRLNSWHCRITWDRTHQLNVGDEIRMRQREWIGHTLWKNQHQPPQGRPWHRIHKEKEDTQETCVVLVLEGISRQTQWGQVTAGGSLKKTQDRRLWSKAYVPGGTTSIRRTVVWHFFVLCWLEV